MKKWTRRLLLVLLLVPILALADPPATSKPPVSFDPTNGNVLPATTNGHPLNLPSGTTLSGISTSLGAAINGKIDKGNVVLISSQGAVTTYVPNANTDAARGVALKTAIAAHSAGDRIVLGPVAPGTAYQLASSIELKPNVVLEGSGYVVVRLADQGSPSFAGELFCVYGVSAARTDNVHIRNITFDCNMQNQSASNACVGAVEIYGGNNSTIENCRAINWGTKSSSIENFLFIIETYSDIGSSYGCRISNCTADTPASIVNGVAGTSAFAISGQGSDIANPGTGWVFSSQIDGCTVHDVTIGTGSGQPYNLECTTFGAAYGCSVTNCKTYNLSNAGGAGQSRGFYIDTYSAQSILFQGNIFAGVDVGIRVANGNSERLSDWIISGNTLQFTSDGIEINPLGSCTLEGFSVYGNLMQRTVPGSGEAIYLTNVSNVNVSNNTTDAGVSVLQGGGTSNVTQFGNKTSAGVGTDGPSYINDNLALGGLTASSLLYANASKTLSSVTLANGLSLTTGTLGLGSITPTTITTGGTTPPSIGATWSGYFFGGGSFNRIGVDGVLPGIELLESGAKQWLIYSSSGNLILFDDSSGGYGQVFGVTHGTGAARFYNSVQVDSISASSLIYSNASKVLSPVTISSPLSLTTGSLSIDLSAYSPLSSPTFTGSVTLPKIVYTGTTVSDSPGTGSPEGAVSAGVGSRYARTDGGAGTSLYVKESGSGNTGWIAYTSNNGNLPTGGTVGQVLVKNSSTNYDASWTADPGGSGGGSGTVTSIPDGSTNGVTWTVATRTTTPTFTLSLGAITPTTIVASGAVSGSNLSGTNTGDQTITLTGDVTGSGTGSFAATIGANKVTIADMATMATASLLGRNTAGTGNVEVLSSSTARGLLGLVIGTNVEAWNTNLDTWATVAPAIGVAAFLTTPSSANLASALTDELGTGKVIFSAGTLAITSGKTLTIPNTLTFSGTDGSTLNVGAGGTLGTAAYTASSAYEVPLTFSTGLTRSTNTITVNTTQSITALSNLTTNGYVKTSGGTGSLSVDASTFAPSFVITSSSFSSTVTPSVGIAGATTTYNIGTLTGNITIGGPTGTPVDGQNLMFRFVQDGTGGRTVTWNSAFAFGTDITAAMEPTAASSKWERAFKWNAADSKWRCTGLARGF